MQSLLMLCDHYVKKEIQTTSKLQKFTPNKECH
jgi:hypothetical protein